MSRRAGGRLAADGETAPPPPPVGQDGVDDVAPRASGAADPERAAIAAALADENMTLVQRIRAVEAIRPPPRPPVGSRPGPGARAMPPPPERVWWETALWALFWLVLIVTFWVETGAYRIILGLGPL